MPNSLATSAKITWCPGCPNSQILVAFRQAVNDLVDGGQVKLENIVACSGIGCHGKITEYLDMNTFTSLHGRSIATMAGIKLANPALTCVGFAGDADTFAEGVEHLVHAARRNADIKLFVHDNRVFALTTGQASPLSPQGFKGKSTPAGSFEEPFDPLALTLIAGATFVARTYAGDIARTKDIMKQAMLHRGFAFVDIIQPCITFFDTRDYFKDNITWMEGPTPTTHDEVAKIEHETGKIPCGIFYQVSKPTYEQAFDA